MSTFNISPNMSLPIPTVGQDPGPDWASNLNSSLTLIDQHDHTSGNGVQITPSGININSDFPMSNNDLTLVRSTRYFSQSAPIAEALDLNCVYVSAEDLYYNDGSGNQVRITQNGSVTGAAGNISGLSSPASASYSSVSDTFIWQSDSNISANLDAGSVIFRNLTTSSNGITVSAPASLSSNYTLVLPPIPSQLNFMTLDASGNMGSALTVDNSTLGISSNTLSVSDEGITQAKLYKRPYTFGSAATAGSVAASNAGGVSFNTTSTTLTAITGLTCQITLTGRPVMITLTGDQTADPETNPFSMLSTASSGFTIILYRGSTSLIGYKLQGSTTQISPITFLETGATGAVTYSVQVKNLSAGNFILTNATLSAYEL